ncbi:MAG TPA: BrnT family toxin [Sedimentisphaerales bacterium]|nr:BrnT family toxin [Sedimentisphaerales bacterium]HRS11745.1 BrnT family toxin [Sedimentisphaerales bacterium]HRV48409.1 BrnT family toxin [Sedimentisphaerales bacterium]
MRFVWDEKKNKQNIRRHGIDFRDVPDMFERPMLLWLDTRQDYGEDRWIGLGLLRSVVAAVVFVEWEEQDTMRIISARKATTYETKQFYEEITY